MVEDHDDDTWVLDDPAVRIIIGNSGRVIDNFATWVVIRNSSEMRSPHRSCKKSR